MTRPQMTLGLQRGTGYGARPDAWRALVVDSSSREDFPAHQRYGLDPRFMLERQ